MMKKMIIKLESFEGMLHWGDEFARMIDMGEPIPETCIRSFEDPEDLLELFSPSRRELLAEIQKQPRKSHHACAAQLSRWRKTFQC